MPLALLQLQDTLLDAVPHYESHHSHRPSLQEVDLAKTVYSVHGLLLNSGVPPRIQEGQHGECFAKPHIVGEDAAAERLWSVFGRIVGDGVEWRKVECLQHNLHTMAGDSAATGQHSPGQA
eukprot:SM000001S04795  [mRNA]  locus=s1:2263554:2267863:+ [translate_table: standard]